MLRDSSKKQYLLAAGVPEENILSVDAVRHGLLAANVIAPASATLLLNLFHTNFKLRLPDPYDEPPKAKRRSRFLRRRRPSAAAAAAAPTMEEDAPSAESEHSAPSEEEEEEEQDDAGWNERRPPPSVRATGGGGVNFFRPILRTVGLQAKERRQIARAGYPDERSTLTGDTVATDPYMEYEYGQGEGRGGL